MAPMHGTWVQPRPLCSKGCPTDFTPRVKLEARINAFARALPIDHLYIRLGSNRNNDVQRGFETIFHSYSTTLLKELNSRLPPFIMSIPTSQAQEYWLPG